MAIAFARIGQVVFDRNRPAVFKHPFYGLLGDFAMFRDLRLGRIGL